MNTPDTARDEVYALFTTAWNAGSNAIAGHVPEIRYKGVLEDDAPDTSKFWCRISMQTVNENQATLSDCVGVAGRKKYTAYGLVFIQIFCPRSNSKCFEIGQKLATLARDSFRGKATPNKVWFRNCRINEIPPEDCWERFNVIAEFEYDELG